MGGERHRTAALATAIALTALAGCGGGGERSTSTAGAVGEAPAAHEPATDHGESGQSEPTDSSAGAAGATGTAPEEATEGAPPDDGGTPEPIDASPGRRRAAAGAERAYRSYLAAINERDGERLCELLPASAERELRPPVDGGDCGERLERSIGYEDPRGYPIWERTVLTGIDSVSIGADPSTVRLTAGIVTELDGREPSIESDIAYLERVAGEWRLAKPTGALFRAIGRAELPPTVIAPPAD